MQFIEDDYEYIVNVSAALAFWKEEMCDDCSDSWDIKFLMPDNKEVTLCFDTIERRDAAFAKLVAKDKPVEDVKVAPAALKFEDITFHDVITCLKKIGFLDVCIAPRKSEVWAEVFVFQLKSTPGTHDFDHRFEYPVPRTIKDWQSLIRRICIRVTPIPIPYFSGNTLDYDFGYDLDLAEPPAPIDVRERPLKFEDIHDDYIKALLDKLGVTDVHMSRFPPENGLLLSFVNKPAREADLVYCSPSTIEDWQKIIQEACRHSDEKLFIPTFIGDTLTYYYETGVVPVVPSAALKFEDITHDYIIALLNRLGFSAVTISSHQRKGLILPISYVKITAQSPLEVVTMTWRKPLSIRSWQEFITELCTDGSLPVPQFIGDTLDYTHVNGTFQVVPPAALKRTVLPLEGLDAEGIKSTCDHAANILEENLIKEGRLEEQPVPETRPLAPGLKFEDITFEYIENLLYKLGFYYITIYPYDESGVAEDDVVFKLESRENKHVWRYPLPKTIKEWQSIICEMCSNARDLPIPSFIGDTLEYDYEKAPKETPDLMPQTTSPTRGRSISPWALPPPLKFEDIQAEHIIAILENLGFREVCVAELSGGAKNIYVSVDTENDGTSRNYRDYYATPKCIADWQAIIKDVCRGTARFIPQFIGDYTLCYIDKAKNKTDEEDIK